MNYELPLSFINQYAYCPRRFWYMYVEAEMIENAHVARGVAHHERVHAQGYETTAPGVVARRSVQVYSHRLGVSGVCDIVEETGGGTRPPLEDKQGQRGRWSNDHAQLCAQALCLEEMTGRNVPRGFLFYFGDRRREEVLFTPELRSMTLNLIQAMQRVVALGVIPPCTDQRTRCNGCSLYDVCLPKETEQYLMEVQR
jgi:CRISPR-associated exonuclease Cas4